MKTQRRIFRPIILVLLALTSSGCITQTVSVTAVYSVQPEIAPPSTQSSQPSVVLSAQTPDGALWTSYDEFHDAGGITSDAEPQGLQRQLDGEQTHLPLDHYVRALKVGPDNLLYVSADCGLLRLRDMEIEVLAEPDCDADEFDQPIFALDIDFDPAGGVWIGGMHGLAHWAEGEWTEYPISSRRFLLEEDGSVWAAGWNGRVGSNCCLTHLDSGEWVTYTYSATLPVSTELEAQIRALLE